MNPLAANSQNILPRVVVSSYLIFCGVYQAEGAAFQNLDFESSPSFPAGTDNPPYIVQPTALPGWTVHIGDTIQNGAWANQSILDSPFVALMTDSRNLLEGQKSVLLQSTYSSPIGFPGAAPINVGISQTGLVRRILYHSISKQLIHIIVVFRSHQARSIFNWVAHLCL